MRREIDNFRKPLGADRNNPGRTCKDILNIHPELKDGMCFLCVS